MAFQRGLVSMSVLVIMVVGTIGGAVVGLIISGHLINQIVLAIICALVAAVLALVAGRRTLGRNLSISLPPGVVLWNVVIASLIGGLAGHELSVDLRDPPAPALVGGVSGILASLLIVSFVVTIVMLRHRLSDTLN